MSAIALRRRGLPVGAVLLGTGLAAVVLAGAGCDQNVGNPGNPGNPGNAAPAMPGPVTLGKPANNYHCLVCHMDFKEESLSVQHEEAGIGCASCHGESLAHGDDEFNIITPDVSFGRAEIDPFCEGCHKTQKKGAIYDAFLKKWQGKRRPNGRLITKESVCTDCHGKHSVLTPDKILEATTPR